MEMKKWLKPVDKFTEYSTTYRKKGKVNFMSMTIGNNVGLNIGSNNTSKINAYKNVREYSNYLLGKYNCLKPGKNVSVSVTSGLE